MALRVMYQAVPNSVPTMLSGLTTATAAELVVDNAGVLPPGPNLATIGAEDNAELVRYTAIEGTRLTGCLRGFGGTAAQIWPKGTMVYRAYTSEDHAAFIANILALEAEKIASDGGLADAAVPFAAASGREAIASGETLSRLFGKIAGWYAALGTAAWAQIGSGAGQVAAGDHLHARYLTLDGHGKLAAGAVSARSVRVTASRALTAADAGCCLDVRAGGDVVLTIPADAVESLPVDTEIEITQEGVGGVIIAPQSGVTLCGLAGVYTTEGVALAGRYAVAVLKKKDEDDWRVTGELA